MDLFRRLFSKTSDEMPSQNSSEEDDKTQKPAGTGKIDEPKNEEPEEIADEIDQADPSTLPITAEQRRTAQNIADGVTQPLSPEVLIANTNSRLTFGQTTDVGLVRNNNQDSALTMFFTSASVDDHPDFGLFIVADGMGGHHDGEKASAITTKTLASLVTQNVYMPMLHEQDVPPISEALVEAVQKSNDEVIRYVPEGGTTVTSIAVVGDLIYVAHVGDTRAYIITAEGIEQITRDHSLVQRLIELDQLTQEEAKNHPQGNVLYRALGQNENVEVDTLTRRMPANSRLLICSDGLWGMIDDDVIHNIAMNTPDPQEACDRMVATANTNGGTDNVTAILLKLS
jgi:PPM family protein phosphatase